MEFLNSLSSLWSGVSKAFAPIASAFAPVLQNSPLMQKLMPILAVVIPPPFDVIAVVALEVISATMGKPENPEELGWQMNMADKKPEDFDSVDDYRAYLDKEYPFDADAFNAQTDEQKAACRYAGMAGVVHELSGMKDLDPKLTPAALGVLAGTATSLGWSPETTKAFTQGLLTAFGGSGALLNQLGSFGKGELSVDGESKIEDGIKAGAKAAGMSETSTVDAFRETAANLESV